MFLTGQSDIVGVCKRLEAKFGRNALMKRRGKDRDVTDSVDDKVPSLRSVSVSQGSLLHPAQFFLTLVTAPMELEDFELHDENGGITDSGEHLDEDGDGSQEEDDLTQELGANLDRMLPNFPPDFGLLTDNSAHVYCAPLLLVTKGETTTRV